MGYKIVIVGGGLSGLDAAVALAQSGHEVTVLEATANLTTIGGSISIPPNSTRTFAHLGLYDRIKKAGRVTTNTAGQFRRYNGEIICDAQERGNYGSEHINIHRANLQELLRNAAEEAGAVIILSSRVATIDETPSSSVAITNDGRRYEADLIVGADGAKSIVRGLIQPAATLDSNWNCFRAVIPGAILEADPDLATLLELPIIWWGPSRTAVGYPMQNKAYYSLELAHPGDTGTAGEWNKRGSIEEMKRMFADFEHVLQKLFNTIKEDDLLVWKLVQLTELERWYSKYGRIVLLGDAAHAVLPYSAQGHAMSTEDSLTLSLILARTNSSSQIPSAVKSFEAIRKPRTSLVAKLSLANAALWQLPDGPEQRARDEAFRNKPMFAKGSWDGKHVDEVPKSIDDKLFYPWLFGHDVKGFTERWLDQHWSKEVTG